MQAFKIILPCALEIAILSSTSLLAVTRFPGNVWLFCRDPFGDSIGLPLCKRHRELLSYFDVGASNGPMEVINGRLEQLRGIALEYRNLGNYIPRSLIYPGQLQHRINAL